MTAPAPRPHGIAPGTLVVDVLGSGSASPTAERDTTSLLVGAPEGWTLVDCPGGVVHKLARRGLRPADLRRLILTHNHVDHVYGFPHLMHALAIAGDAEVLDLAAPAQTLATVRAMVAAHGLEGERYPRLVETELELGEAMPWSGADGLGIRTAPAAHSRDTVSLRFECGAAAVCHSSDTRPNEATTGLARGVDLLLHDCAGPHRLREHFAANHSSAREAGEVAAAAGVTMLVLIHIGVAGEEILQECRREAEESFGGAVELARDGDVWRLPATGSD